MIETSESLFSDAGELRSLNKGPIYARSFYFLKQKKGIWFWENKTRFEGIAKITNK
jgi:hypothetical protein